MSVVDELISSGFSPAAITNAAYGAIDRALAGTIDIVDTTNPMSTLIEMGACLAAGTISREAVTLRKQYKSLAASREDLYYHMSDEDYLDSFCSYGSTKFYMLFRKDEIETKAITDTETGIRKIIIPKHTKIEVDNVTFTMLYPIEIRIMPHGGYQVVYDTSVPSPIATLETNYIEWKTVTVDGNDYVMFYLTLPQLKRVVYQDTLNPSIAFVKTYTIDDQFYYCRIFGTDANGDRIEFATTHSEVVYDKTIPTAVVQLIDSGVRIEIPRIYFSEEQIQGSVDIVIYTSKGDINLNFSAGYEINRFTMTLGTDYNTPTDSLYSAPLLTWTNMAVASDDILTGGKDGLTFEEMRERVIQNASSIKYPISSPQIKAKLANNGYDIVASVDDVMERVYLATRHLPAVPNSGFSSGAGAAIETLMISTNELAAYSCVIDNGDRVTLTPDAVFKNDSSGLLKLVDPVTIPDASSADTLVAYANADEYMFTLFHYVIDSTNNQFSMRPYYLDAPKIASRRFIAENETAQLGVSTDGITLEKTESGYLLTITTICSEEYLAQDPSQLFVQLSYIPKNEESRAVISGIPYGITPAGNLVWQFELDSTFDVDSNDFLQLNNFSIYSSQNRPFGVALQQEFEIVYGITNYTIFGLKVTDIDLKIGTHLLTSPAVGLTNEAVTINFGTALSNLWSNARTFAGSVRYETYTEDVPKLWDDVYLTGPDGNPVLGIDGEGNLTYTKIHSAGDPVLDSENNPEYYWRAGDVKLDANGDPIPLYDRDTIRLMDFCLIDGVYRFANYQRDLDYRASIASTIAKYASSDMQAFKSVLLEKTSIFFQPKKTLGRIKVIVKDGLQIEIDAALGFTVRYYMEKSKYVDLDLRETIVTKTKTIINSALESVTVSKATIMKLLKAMGGEDIIDVDMDGMGDNNDIPVFTSADDATRCAVKRRLKALPDNSIQVEEAITVDFLLHKP